MPQEHAKGKYGKAEIGSTTVHLTSWTYEESGDDADTTNSGTSGVKTTEDQNTQYAGTCEGIYDLNAMPHANPPRIRRGTTGTLKLYTSPEAFFSIPMRILGVRVNSTQADAVRYSFDYAATAAPTYPLTTAVSSSSSSSSST